MDENFIKDEAKGEENRRKRVAEEVTKDFLNRRELRRSVENGWKLNMNFVSGNQYCDVSPFGELVEDNVRFYWQSRRAFNHIAPLIDARVAKLLKCKPRLRVKAFSDEDGDVKAAKLADGILRYVEERIGLDDILARGLVWSEICGSVFYKTLWDEKGGRRVGVDELGEPLYEGEMEIVVVPPFEIFPDRLDVENLRDARSIIHAQVVDVGYVYEKFGVSVVADEDLDEGMNAYSEPSSGKIGAFGASKTKVEDAVLLLERYTAPCAAYPEGRLEIVAGGELLFEGESPYLCGERGERTFPFVKQDCVRLPAAFFGSSIVDRLIPVQRAYNAVRNRKHEFLNRVATGTFAVEDGSVDVDALEEEGLAPGKIVVYRQGAKPPQAVDFGTFPREFEREEEWLEKEFSLVSGVSDLSQNSTPAGVTSATGLQLLLSQDDSRLSASIESFKEAIREIGVRTLRTYRQFVGNARLMTLAGENGRVGTFYFGAGDVPESDLRFDFEEVASEDKKETLLKLFEAGLLIDDDGKISKENRERVLEAFGFGSYENAKDISALHRAKAGEENLAMKSAATDVEEFDDHEIHIAEHTRFLLSEEFKSLKNKEEAKRRFVEHIAAHKAN